MVIYPEGSTQNNSLLCPFKRGAFMTKTTVTPMALKYHCPQFMPFNECINEPECLILYACNWRRTKIESIIMPAFQPNDYLFEKHRKPG
jgi:hypothetical protein